MTSLEATIFEVIFFLESLIAEESVEVIGNVLEEISFWVAMVAFSEETFGAEGIGDAGLRRQTWWVTPKVGLGFVLLHHHHPACFSEDYAASALRP